METKPRYDGKGDEWAKIHRNLPSSHTMTDIDTMFGFQAFGQNTTDRLFVEYAYERTDEVKKNFRIVAIFERKFERSKMLQYSIQHEFLCWIARIVSNAQELPCRLFYAVNSSSPGWFDLFETNIETHEFSFVASHNKDDINAVWQRLGLSKLRSELSKHCNILDEKQSPFMGDCIKEQLASLWSFSKKVN